MTTDADQIPRKRISKAQWLERALDVLATEGAGGLRIERLARDLEISKSGFYWHFKNRQDLLDQLLQYWEDEYTNTVVHSVDQLDPDPATRLLQIMTMIEEHDLARYDLAMRAWADQDEAVAELVERVYGIRMQLIGSLFRKLGFRGDELEMRTRLFVCNQSWQQTMFGQTDPKLAQKLRARRHQLLIRK